MKKTLLVLVGLFISAQAFALQSLNCSNSDGSSKREEQEVWGANLIKFTNNGKVIKVQEESFENVVVLENIEDGNFGIESKTTIYAANVVWIEAKTETVFENWMICTSWSNNALD